MKTSASGQPFPSIAWYPHHPLKLHVKYRRVKDHAAVWIAGILLKWQGQWQSSLLLWSLWDFNLLVLLLHPYRQWVTVDVVDPGVVLCCLRLPEEGERVDEAGRPLHSFNRHRVLWLPAGHCTLIHMGSLWLPDEENDTNCTYEFNAIPHCFVLWIHSSFKAWLLIIKITVCLWNIYQFTRHDGAIPYDNKPWTALTKKHS